MAATGGPLWRCNSADELAVSRPRKLQASSSPPIDSADDDKQRASRPAVCRKPSGFTSWSAFIQSAWSR